MRPEAGIFKLRSSMQAYANLRPIRSWWSGTISPLRPELVEGLDLLIVRELTGGLYFGERGRDDDGAPSTRSATASTRSAGSSARASGSRGPRAARLTSVDKANVLDTSRLWRELADEMSRRVPRRAARPPARRLDDDEADRAADRVRRDRHREPLRRHPLRPRRLGLGRHRARALRLARRRRPGHLRADPRHGARHRRHRPGEPRRDDPDAARCCCASSARPPRPTRSRPRPARCSRTAPARPTWAAHPPPTRSPTPSLATLRTTASTTR